MGVTSPLKYLQTRTKALPFHECYMTQNWKEVKMASVLISREMPSGNFVVGIYLVDMLALGVKDTFYRFNMSPTEYEDFVSNINASQEQPMISSDLHLAHNIIFGALDFGEEHGFRPHTKTLNSPNSSWMKITLRTKLMS